MAGKGRDESVVAVPSASGTSRPFRDIHLAILIARIRSFVKTRTLRRLNVRAFQIMDPSVMSNQHAIVHEWPSKSRKAALVLAIALLATALRAHAEDSAYSDYNWGLPADVTRVLSSPDKAILYSLEPWEEPAPTESKLHGFKILGQMDLDLGLAKTVATQFREAIARGTGAVTACFDPRHALSVTSGGVRYDLLLCYGCGQLEIFSADRMIADLSAGGTAEKLNAILSANHLPLSRSGLALETMREQGEVAESRWLAAMPSALKPFRPQELRGNKPNLEPLNAALFKELPQEQPRILALYAWFGSGKGPWSGFPSYETVAEELLLEYQTEALIEAVQAAGSAQQLEGAARLFGGWTFSQRRPSDMARLPPDLKRRLLAHSLESADEDNRYRAHHAFD
jgi:hypothetical protein